MQYLIYILLYPILLLISILPFKLLYLFSDIVCFLVYRIIGYRTKIVRNNLLIALPNLSDSERKIIEKKFYSHMCDLFLEMIKTMTISQNEIEKRFTFTNLETYIDLEKKGKSIALVCSHYASYEWVLSMNKYINFKGYGIYKRVNNKYFDQLVRKIRSRFKAHLITTRETKSVIENNSINGVLSLYGFASDQSPLVKPNTYWSTFMGIETPVYVGAEMLSKRFDMNMVFLKTRKIKRGYYQAEIELLAENVRDIPDFQITELFLRKVETLIHEAPEFYLWTHKRWKHRNKNTTI